MDCHNFAVLCRTYLESEVDNIEPRMDLLTKMLQIDSNEPTPTERRIGVTKLRYMKVRNDMMSTPLTPRACPVSTLTVRIIIRIIINNRIPMMILMILLMRIKMIIII